MLYPLREPDKKYAALEAFVSFVADHCQAKGTEQIIVGWNLQYEFTQLFADFTIDIRTADDWDVEIVHNGPGRAPSRWRMVVMNNRRFRISLENLATKRRVSVIDGMAYFVTGLDRAGAMLGLGAKLTLCGRDHPASDECKRCTERKRNLTVADLDDAGFMAYARQDAWLTRKIGEEIVAMHEMYDVPTCMSAPHFAARVFRRHFLTGEIPLAGAELEQAGLYAYHGGKNGYYLDGPKMLPDVIFCDLVSAYPEAMRALPNPVTASWERVTEYRRGMHALYCISGHYRACRYRGAQDHAGKWLEADTYLDGVWLTSYEVDALVSLGELDIITAHGWAMIGEPGGPLVEYVDRFFAEKRESTGAKREAAKLFLNSLYGKFFQKVPLGDVGYWEVDVFGKTGKEPERVAHNPGDAFDYQAGGLYHPPIAALITGYVRGKIHRLEHRHRAVMTSTDGLFAMRAPASRDVGRDLGMLTATRGSLRIWRERLYIFSPIDGAPKAALHGWHAKMADLARIPLARGTYAYTASQVVTLKQAGKAYNGVRYRPGVFAELDFTLILGP
jgi:DNA polymerase type B, organellar and viral